MKKIFSPNDSLMPYKNSVPFHVVQEKKIENQTMQYPMTDLAIHTVQPKKVNIRDKSGIVSQTLVSI